MTAWINHVKEFAKNKGISYSCALSDPNCSASYKKREKFTGLPGITFPIKKQENISSSSIEKRSSRLIKQNPVILRTKSLEILEKDKPLKSLSKKMNDYLKKL